MCKKTHDARQSNESLYDNTSKLPYMAFYWYALFHRKKAIPITFREQVFYRDIGNVARENSGKKGPISYFCLGNVPQSTPPSTNREQYPVLLQAGELALHGWALLANGQATRLT